MVNSNSALNIHYKSKCCKKNQEYFKEKTTGHCIITGRKNYESIPEKYRPLPNRTNIIITRQKDYNAQGAKVVGSIDEALEFAKQLSEDEVFIIGGAEIFRQTIDLADKLYVTKIDHTFTGDVFFPEIDIDLWEQTKYIACKADEKNIYDYSFLEFKKSLSLNSTN